MVEPFFGAHQAGIATAAQERIQFAAFNVLTNDRAALQALLKTWTAAAIAMTAGQPVGDPAGDVNAPPSDTGEALGLGAARLTLTFGFGPSLFGSANGDRFGLAALRPAALADLPPFAHDELDPAASDGDLCVQACAEDPQVAFHAIRELARIGRGTVAIRWSQLGFGRTSSTIAAQATPRNLQGFLDGTNNVHGDDQPTMDEHIWVGASDDPPWMARRNLPRGAPDPDADRGLGSIEPGRPGGDDRAQQAERRAADRTARSTTPSTSRRSGRTASR